MAVPKREGRPFSRDKSPADLEPVRGFSSFPLFFNCFFSLLFFPGDTPLQVFPVHTPVRRGQSGTPSQGRMVPGQVRRALALR